MSEQREISIPSQVDRLNQLVELLPSGNEYLYQFSTFLAGRIVPGRKVTPLDFVIAAEFAIDDLKKGVDGFTHQPIRSNLVGLPDQAYSQLSFNVPIIAKAVYPEDFAKQVEEIYQRLGETRRTKEDKP